MSRRSSRNRSVQNTKETVDPESLEEHNNENINDSDDDYALVDELVEEPVEDIVPDKISKKKKKNRMILVLDHIKMR